MIGVFDSGVGGLTILRALRAKLPEHDFCYLGDNARAPYGSRDADDIYLCTRDGVDWLFGQGAQIVILACNTASANALRRLQKEYLPKAYPNRRVLGILVPTVEAISGIAWHDKHRTNGDAGYVLVFGTPAMVCSGAYTAEIRKRSPNVHVIEHPCPTLVPLIERGARHEEISAAVHACVDGAERVAQGHWPPSAVLLGCTHYPLIVDDFISALPKGLVIYDQGTIAADALAKYLDHHKDIDALCRKGGVLRTLTTGDATELTTRASTFYGMPLVFDALYLPKYQDS